jgi:adenosylmethionine-8-amino-7-oxononanoate aminotransferase
MRISLLIYQSDVYNMQFSNEPAEELAKILVDSGEGAFELCGFVSGGSEAMEAVIKLARQVSVLKRIIEIAHVLWPS